MYYREVRSPDPDATRLIAITTHIARIAIEHKQAEERIIKSAGELRLLTERLINAQEEERKRIARELHDDLGQQIAGLSIWVSHLKGQIPAQQYEAREQAEQLQRRLPQLASRLRNLSHQLHPTILEHVGLPTALRSYCAEFSSLNAMTVTFQATGTFEGVPPPVALCIYRLVQEALHNVAKHAATKDAEVCLVRSSGAVYLRISDQGVGFQLSQARASGGLGLASMRERVRLVNGLFVLESAPNCGTTLRVEIPNGQAHPPADRAA
jgi:signal transduction histidine kinase